MRDAEMKDGKGMIWQQKEWNLTDDRERSLTFPKEMLECKALGREITFYSAKPIEKFNITQIMRVNEMELEKFTFDFGFVIPRSENSWEQIIERDDEVMPAEVLSGNFTVETLFNAGETTFARQIYRVYYK